MGALGKSMDFELVHGDSLREISKALHKLDLTLIVVFDRVFPTDLVEKMELRADEHVVGLDLSLESDKCRSEFEVAGKYDCMALGLAEGTKFPLPYIIPFVPGEGPLPQIMSAEDLSSALDEARKEAKEVRVARLASHSERNDRTETTGR